MPNRGVIYLVTGRKIYLDECIFSALSLKKNCPDLPITLFTDRAVSKECFDEVKIIDSSIHPFKLKIKCLMMSPYEESLYLDTDTKIVKPIYELFDSLKEYDLAVANNPHIDKTRKPAKLIKYAKENSYNTGLVLYKKSENMNLFLNEWLGRIIGQDESDMWSGHRGDQAHFNSLIKEGLHQKYGLKLQVLPNTSYNVRQFVLKQLKKEKNTGKVKIIHQHCLHMNSLSLFLWKVNRKLQGKSTGVLTKDL